MTVITTARKSTANIATYQRSTTKQWADYRVVWEIDVPAGSILEAAEAAQAIQRDRRSTATIYWVTRPGSETPGMIDLLRYRLRRRMKVKGVARNRRLETVEDYMRVYPRITAHIICHSLGYATPTKAAMILKDAYERRENWCEWIYKLLPLQPASGSEALHPRPASAQGLHGGVQAGEGTRGQGERNWRRADVCEVVLYEGLLQCAVRVFVEILNHFQHAESFLYLRVQSLSCDKPYHPLLKTFCLKQSGRWVSESTSSRTTASAWLTRQLSCLADRITAESCTTLPIATA